ncbi:hypothetical protein BGZ76_001968 [Entomortierella beljakovae]|nr:hypothetical protein BGZ76_001968 [Entomortierella beljakovae]
MTYSQLKTTVLGIQPSIYRVVTHSCSYSIHNVPLTIRPRAGQSLSSVTKSTYFPSVSSRSFNTSPSFSSSASSSFRSKSPPFKSVSSLNHAQHSPHYNGPTTELPSVKSRAPFYILLGVLGVSFWAGSLAIAANHQKQGTSVVRGTLFNVKFDTKAQELLGDNIDFTNSKWPWIYGTVAHLKGRVDIEYQVKGDKAEGRVHFVAVRPVKQWITTDFTLTMPDGTCVPLGEHMALPDLP